MGAFEFGGVDAGDYGLTVVGRSTPPGMADPQMHTFDLLGRDGVLIDCSRRKPMYITAECMITAATRLLAEGYLDGLYAALDPLEGEQLLVFDDDHVDGRDDRGYMAILQAPSRPYWKAGGLAYSIQLAWLVPGGVRIGVEDVEQECTIESSPDTWDVPADIGEVAQTVGGQLEAYPVYVITNTSAVTATGVKLTNVTTGDELTWTGSLAQDEQLKIDARREIQTVYHSDDEGATWTVSMQGVTLGDPFPWLRAGVQNQLRVTGVTAGTLDITYRERFL